MWCSLAVGETAVGLRRGRWRPTWTSGGEEGLVPPFTFLDAEDLSQPAYGGARGVTKRSSCGALRDALPRPAREACFFVLWQQEHGQGTSWIDP